MSVSQPSVNGTRVRPLPAVVFEKIRTHFESRFPEVQYSRLSFPYLVLVLVLWTSLGHAPTGKGPHGRVSSLRGVETSEPGDPWSSPKVSGPRTDYRPFEDLGRSPGFGPFVVGHRSNWTRGVVSVTGDNGNWRQRRIISGDRGVVDRIPDRVSSTSFYYEIFYQVSKSPC